MNLTDYISSAGQIIEGQHQGEAKMKKSCRGFSAARTAFTGGFLLSAVSLLSCKYSMAISDRTLDNDRFWLLPQDL